MKEEEVLLLLNKDDLKSYEFLFKKFYVQLCNLAENITCDTAAAEDVVQQVYLKVCKNGFRKSGNFSSLKSVEYYLITAIKNESLNFCKLRNRQMSIAALSEETKTHLSPQLILERKELSNEVVKALEQLPQKRRRVFEWNYMHGLSYREIADKENISVNTVDNHIAKALRSLRVQLLPLMKGISVLLLLM